MNRKKSIPTGWIQFIRSQAILGVVGGPIYVICMALVFGFVALGYYVASLVSASEWALSVGAIVGGLMGGVLSEALAEVRHRLAERLGFKVSPRRRLFAPRSASTPRDGGKSPTSSGPSSQGTKTRGDSKIQRPPVITPPESTRSKALKALGLTDSASADEIRRAFRTLARQWHPDRFATGSLEEQGQASRRFMRARAAYNYLRRATGGRAT